MSRVISSGPELGVSRHHLVLVDMDGGEHVVAHDTLAEKDRVLVVVAVPRHEGDECVAAERQVADIGRRPVGDDVALLDPVSHRHQRALVDAGRLVRALELLERVDVHARLRRRHVLGGTQHDAGCVHLVDDARPARHDGGARIARDHRLHARAHEGRLGAQERHRLALHVRAHEGAVGVVVLQERDERGGDRHELARRHVHQVDVLARSQRHFAVVARDDELLGEGARLGQLGVGLRDVVLGLLHRGQVDDLVGHVAVDDAPVRALDEAVLVDAREGGERVDEADIRPLRRLDGADTAVMGRVHVAHLEAGALAGQAAGPERRQAALVRHLGERVHLVHELAELAGAEELAHRGGRRLGVDEVLRHDGVDLDGAHALLDRTLHAQEADAVLVLHQLADRAHAPVAEIVDVVDLALAVAQLVELPHDLDDVLAAQRALRVGHVHQAQAHVHLHPADGRQVVALGVEEQRLEHRLRGVDGGRLARADDAVDVEQRIAARLVLVDRQRRANVAAHVDVVDDEDGQVLDALLQEIDQETLALALRVGLERQLVAGLGPDLARVRIDDVLGKVLAVQFLVRRADELETAVGQLLGLARRDLLALAGLDRDLARLGVDEVGNDLHALPLLGIVGQAPAIAVALVVDAVVIGGQNLLGVHAEGHQERGDGDLALAVDARVDDVLGVELDVEPGAAIGDDARGEQQLARRVRLALVVVEEHAGRAVHLRDDNALGAVDDEGAVGRHQGHVAHVDVLLLELAHRLGARVLVDVEHDQAQRHPERRGIGHVALAALVDVELGRLELVGHELELGGACEVADGEDGPEDGLQTLLGAPALGRVHHQELLVGGLLHLDEVGHRRGLDDVAVELARAAASVERLLGSHCGPLDPSMPGASARDPGAADWRGFHGPHRGVRDPSNTTSPHIARARRVARDGASHSIRSGRLGVSEPRIWRRTQKRARPGMDLARKSQGCSRNTVRAKREPQEMSAAPTPTGASDPTT